MTTTANTQNAAEPRCADCGHGTLAHNAIGGACTKCDCGHFRPGTRCLGPCGGRKLTSAKSIAAGYGPACFRKIREAALAEARADFSADQQAKADELIRDGGLVPTNRPGIFRSVSSKGDATYLTHSAACTCHAGLKGRRCYHLLAARILGIASRRSLAKAA